MSLTAIPAQASIYQTRLSQPTAPSAAAAASNLSVAVPSTAGGFTLGSSHFAHAHRGGGGHGAKPATTDSASTDATDLLASTATATADAASPQQQLASLFSQSPSRSSGSAVDLSA